jgi:membrane-bound lytic murein transglycosylase B
LVFALSILLLACAPVLANEEADDGSFGRCVQTLQVRAREEGISNSVVDAVLGNVNRVERVIELDRNQPEFTRTFADYYDRRVTDQRVERGRRLRDEERELLDDVWEWAVFAPRHNAVENIVRAISLRCMTHRSPVINRWGQSKNNT